MKIEILNTKYHQFGFTYDYNADVLKFCRLLKDSWGWQNFSFDPGHKAWVFSDPRIIEAVYERFPEAVISPEVRELVKDLITLEQEKSRTAQFIEELKHATESDIVISGLKKELYPFQKVGVEFLVRSKGRAILGDDPGLGKSAQTIGYIQVAEPKRTLIISPATMKFSWEAEIAKWSELSTQVIESDTHIASISPDTRVWIINYDIVTKHLEELLKVKFELLVLDEAHYIKSPTAKRSKSVRKLAKGIDRVVMLTGTPILNRPIELYNLLSTLNEKEWGSYFRFASRYAAAHRTRFGLDVSGSSNMEELKTRMAPYFLRRTKEEVLAELPPKVHTLIPIELTGEYRRMYDKAENEFARFLRENKGKREKEVRQALQAEKLTRMNALREIASSAVVSDALEIINNVVASGEKILVFSSFNFPVEVLQSKLGHQAVILTGKTPNEERFDLVKTFQNDPTVQVFLGGIKSAGVGITLTAASHVLFLDYSWTPADHKQAEDRAHRADELTKTHESINIYQLHAMDTIHDLLKKMLDKKKKTVDSVIGGFDDDDQSAMNMVLAEMEARALGEA